MEKQKNALEKITARLEAAVSTFIRGLEHQLSLLKRADPTSLARAVEVFGSEESSASWLVKAESFSENKMPLQLAISLRGRKQILDALGRIEHSIL